MAQWPINANSIANASPPTQTHTPSSERFRTAFGMTRAYIPLGHCSALPNHSYPLLKGSYRLLTHSYPLLHDSYRLLYACFTVIYHCCALH